MHCLNHEFLINKKFNTERLRFADSSPLYGAVVVTMNVHIKQRQRETFYLNLPELAKNAIIRTAFVRSVWKGSVEKPVLSVRVVLTLSQYWIIHDMLTYWPSSPTLTWKNKHDFGRQRLVLGDTLRNISSNEQDKGECYTFLWSTQLMRTRENLVLQWLEMAAQGIVKMEAEVSFLIKTENISALYSNFTNI